MQAPPVYLTASDCQKLIPERWKDGVESAPLPQKRSVGELAAFGDAQTGQLDIANGRYGDSMWIQAQCEALLKKAGQAAQPRPWWKFWG